MGVQYLDGFVAENAVYGLRIHNNMQRIKNWRLVLAAAAMNNYVIRYIYLYARDFLLLCMLNIYISLPLHIYIYLLYQREMR